MAYFEGGFKVRHGRVTHPQNVSYIQSPNYSNSIDPRYLILHYTAGRNGESSVNWMKNPKSKASAHFVVDTNGQIIQMVKTNKRAWHAGRSNYKGLTGLNKYSLGIEMVNPGHLEILGGGKYKSWFGEIYDAEDHTIIEGVHKHMGGSPKGWMQATPEQIESTIMLGRFLMEQYDLDDVLPHEDISISRKWDTGLTISDSVYEKIRGRGDAVMSDKGDDEIYEVSVNTYLNMRDAPNGNRIASLPNATLVTELKTQGDWMEVITHENSMVGWVSKRFLNRV